ncbi:hypothetical protein GobsT_15050 [Gemmata obscuriglobus]|nr:glycosyltransferase [Gemmata obscuriglobus]QEG26758.1 hypothetical protein GobsT_15050 [Gemmata obscuriglobus]VTS02564.1 Uncharacterized protein OS=Stanieria cyanosphaera (strain ATCC 29371 / PCC 7437) GN=Sta7437_2231 PE=4 SV=1 [Gemmata obscuriglobus UQM 2246]
MRRVLIVSPHFPPVNAPDCQRVRMALPHLREFGWDAHVLAVDPSGVEGFLDPDLARTLPAGQAVTRVPAVPAWLTRAVGFGGLWLRAGRRLAAAGAELLRRERFDLVFFSTTIFSAMKLGPRWLRRFGVPYVIDLQDPWVSDYYSRTGTPPPGGRLRYALAQWGARRAEPTVVRHAGHVATVSPAYADTLRARYPDVPAERYTVLPFAAAASDFQVVAERKIEHGLFDPADGLRHWVYLGRGGADLAPALRGLFGAFAAVRRSDARADRVRMHFVGTSYAKKGLARESVRPLARAAGLAAVVTEQTDRLPYLRGVSLLRAAGALLVVGSDDPSYSASKVYPYIMARRPLLAVLHENSPAAAVITACRAGEVVPFASGESTEALAARLAPALGRLLAATGTEPPTDWAAFAPYTAREMTRVLCRAFDSALPSPHRTGPR